MWWVIEIFNGQVGLICSFSYYTLKWISIDVQCFTLSIIKRKTFNNLLPYQSLQCCTRFFITTKAPFSITRALDLKTHAMSISKLDTLAKMYAFENLGETREAVIEGVREMKAFINGDWDLRDVVISEFIILYFLRANKYRLERAKKKIKR
jgi:hypothetical protein